MVERKLNLDIEKSVGELESIAKEINLNSNKKEATVKKRDDKLPPDKESEKRLNLGEAQSLLKKWRNIFNVFLIFSIFMFILLIFIMSFYYKEDIREQEKIMQNDSENYISSAIHLTSKLDNSSFHLVDFADIYKRNMQNFIIIKDEACKPNISCEYTGYMREYDLYTIVNQDFLLDKNVINCYDSSNCVSNFTYLESSSEPFSRQKIKIEKEGGNMLNVYNEDDVLIAKLEKKYLGGVEKLFIWFKF